jgi:hypothetical protein
LLITQTFLDRYRSEHGDLPPGVVSLIHSFKSEEL